MWDGHLVVPFCVTGYDNQEQEPRTFLPGVPYTWFVRMPVHGQRRGELPAGGGAADRRCAWSEHEVAEHDVAGSGASSPQLAAPMIKLSVQLARGDAERLLRRGVQIRREVYGEECSSSHCSPS